MTHSPSPTVFPANTPYTASHQWPWRPGEFGTMAFFFGICLASGLAFRTVPGLIGGLLAGVGAVYWLYRTKKSRVGISQVTATITGTRVQVYSRGALGSSAVDLSRVTIISARRFGSDECFMLSDGTQAARLPLRLTKDPVIRAALDHVFTVAETKRVEAEDLYARMTAGDIPG